MTLEEKAAFLSGKTVWETRDIKRLGIPSVFCSDGPHGLRKQAGEGDHLGLNASVPATCFPTAATIANSWDEKLGEEIGEALGEEAQAQNVHILLGPGLNIKRSPLCGRNFEYFSEDPYLAGKMAASYIRGIQSKGVSACPKHFAVNSQELRRMAMNAVLDERTLREIYLTGFEIAVKEGGARAIMTSYNEVNGTYANENEHLLKDILRGEWGFDGVVITDWGGSNDHAKGVTAGSDLEMPMPGLDSARILLKAVEEGKLTEGEVDACVDRLLDAVLKLTDVQKKEKCTYEQSQHHELARKASAESIVLLKNDENILPLQSGVKVAVIGDFAIKPRYQGAGSSMVNPTFLETIEKSIERYDLEVIGSSGGYRRNGEVDETLAKEALSLAEQADIVLYFFGLDEVSESEGLDRRHMHLPENQIRLLENVAKKNVNLVGILSGGSAIEMPWEGCCKAILHGYLGGQAGAGAMLDVLTGKINPSGKLAETYPLRYEDTPAYRYFPSKERNSEYREGIYVGYRYYDTAEIPVRYPFGYGLSYTTFCYSDLQIKEKEVKLVITNAGDRSGSEIVQLYVGKEQSEVFRPKRELKGFARVFLEAGESKRITIPLDDKTFRFWNVKTNRWETESGTYQIMIGADSADIRLHGTLEIKGNMEVLPYDKVAIQDYLAGTITDVDDAQFEALLGHAIPSGKWSGRLGINDAICQMYYAKSAFARLLYKLLTGMKEKSEAKGKPDLNILFIYNMPFRGIAKMTNGAVSMEMAEGMVTAVNGHFFKGFKQIISGFFKNRKANAEYEKMLAGKETE